MKRFSAEAVRKVETPLGEVLLWGRDTGRPVLLVLTGLGAGATTLDHLQAHVSGMDVWRIHLPGNHCPALSRPGLAVAACAVSAVAGRVRVVLGLSLGAAVALRLVAPAVRQMVLVEPLLSAEGAAPVAEAMRASGFDPCELARIAPTIPTTVLVGGPGGSPPSLLTAGDVAFLGGQPLVRVIRAGEGHAVTRTAPMAVFEAIRAAVLAFRDSENADKRDVEVGRAASA